LNWSTLKKTALLGICLGGIFSSGCITVSSPTFSKNAGKKSKIQQVSYENTIPETPGDPKNPEQLKLAYARWMEEIHDVVEARKHYSAVAEVEPKNVAAILGLARLDQVTGQYAEAEQKFKRAIKMSPDSPIAQYSLGQFYASQQRWDESKEPLTAAMLADPENVTYRFQLAVAFVHTDDISSALPHFIRTVGDAEGHYNVGLILLEEERYDEAEKHFLLAVTKNPELKQAQQRLVKLRERKLDAGTPAQQQTGNTHSAQIVPVALRSIEESRAFPVDAPGVSSIASPTPQQQEQSQNQQPLSSL